MSESHTVSGQTPGRGQRAEETEQRDGASRFETLFPNPENEITATVAPLTFMEPFAVRVCGRGYCYSTNS